MEVHLVRRKKDSVGISPLQNEKGEHVIDSKEKAEILNSQYNSVFTTEDLNNIPDLGPSNTNNIRPLEISKTGIEKQLKQLNLYIVKIHKNERKRLYSNYKESLTCLEKSITAKIVNLH
jgi:hypothetical protein